MIPGMERFLRLRRTTQRDYSQTVEFPVEIVGRDGKVRRFSYDESVRLYQRRIRSAALRFDELSEAEEEVLHCHQRIEQLRRSYLEYFDVASLRTAQASRPGAVLGTVLAAEVVSFLRRAFPEEVDAAPPLQCTVVGSEVHDLLFVRVGERSYLLYAWRLDGRGGAADDSAAARADWREVRERLSGIPTVEGVERLLSSWHSSDCAIVLSGSGELPEVPEMEETTLPSGSDPFLDGMRALYDGQIGQALAVFEGGLEQQPGRRSLAASAALVALLDEQPERAVFNACAGRLQHVQDPLLRYLHVLALCHRRQFEEAWRLLEEEQQHGPLREGPEMLLCAMFRLRRGNISAAVTLLRHLHRAPSELRFVPRTAGRMLTAIAQAVGLLVVGLVAIGLAGVMLQAHPVSAALLAMIGMASVLPLPFLVRFGVDRVLSTRHPTLHLLSTELLPRERRLEPA